MEGEGLNRRDNEYHHGEQDFAEDRPLGTQGFVTA